MLIENGAKDICQGNGDENILHKFALKIGYDFNNLIISILPKFLSLHNQSYTNALNIDGATPLMLAVKYAHSESSLRFIELLIKCQANLRFVDKNGYNIWHYFDNNIFVSNQFIMSSISNYLTNANNLINERDYNNRKPLEHTLFLKRSKQIQKIRDTLKEIPKNVDDFHNPITKDRKCNNLKTLE